MEIHSPEMLRVLRDQGVKAAIDHLLKTREGSMVVTLPSGKQVRLRLGYDEISQKGRE